MVWSVSEANDDDGVHLAGSISAPRSKPPAHLETCVCVGTAVRTNLSVLVLCFVADFLKSSQEVSKELHLLAWVSVFFAPFFSRVSHCVFKDSWLETCCIRAQLHGVPVLSRRSSCSCGLFPSHSHSLSLSLCVFVLLRCVGPYETLGIRA